MTELHEGRAEALEPVDRAVRRRGEPGEAPGVGDLPDEALGDGEGEHHVDDHQAQQLGDPEPVDGRHVDFEVLCRRAVGIRSLEVGDRGGRAEVGGRPAARPHRHHRRIAQRDDADQPSVVDDGDMAYRVPRHELAGVVLVGAGLQRVQLRRHALAYRCRFRVLAVDDELSNVAFGDYPDRRVALDDDDRRRVVCVELTGGVGDGLVRRDGHQLPGHHVSDGHRVSSPSVERRRLQEGTRERSTPATTVADRRAGACWASSPET